MKLVSTILILLFLSANGWAAEKLFSFFSDHATGSQLSSGEEGMTELPEVEIFGLQFSSYYELDADKTIQNAGLYLRSNASDVSTEDIQRVFGLIRSAIVAESGEAESFKVPNFEDATERNHSMMGWRDEDSILILQKFEFPGGVEVDIRHLNWDRFSSNLGADFGSFVLPKLETKSGELRIPSVLSSDREAEVSPPAVQPSRKIEMEAVPESVQVGNVKPDEERDSIRSEEADPAAWPYVLLAVALVGIFVIVVRSR